jgi:hypothetical protein
MHSIVAAWQAAVLCAGTLLLCACCGLTRRSIARRPPAGGTSHPGVAKDVGAWVRELKLPPSPKHIKRGARLVREAAGPPWSREDAGSSAELSTPASVAYSHVPSEGPPSCDAVDTVSLASAGALASRFTPASSVATSVTLRPGRGSANSGCIPARVTEPLSLSRLGSSAALHDLAESGSRFRFPPLRRHSLDSLPSDLLPPMPYVALGNPAFEDDPSESSCESQAARELEFEGGVGHSTGASAPLSTAATGTLDAQLAASGGAMSSGLEIDLRPLGCTASVCQSGALDAIAFTGAFDACAAGGDSRGDSGTVPCSLRLGETLSASRSPDASVRSMPAGVGLLPDEQDELEASGISAGHMTYATDSAVCMSGATRRACALCGITGTWWGLCTWHPRMKRPAPRAATLCCHTHMVR